MSRSYKRDRRGRFATVGSARRNRKIQKLTDKNKRVARRLAADKSIAGTPLAASLHGRMARRNAKIAKLRSKR